MGVGRGVKKHGKKSDIIYGRPLYDYEQFVDSVVLTEYMYDLNLRITYPLSIKIYHSFEQFPSLLEQCVTRPLTTLFFGCGTLLGAA